MERPYTFKDFLLRPRRSVVMQLSQTQYKNFSVILLVTTV